MVPGRRVSKQIEVEILTSSKIVSICVDRIPGVGDANVVYVKTGIFRRKQSSGRSVLKSETETESDDLKRLSM